MPRCWAVLIMGASVMLMPAQAAERSDPLDLSTDTNTAWVADRPTGDDFLPPPSGPGPVMSAPGHPYIPNGVGGRPTYRAADLTNPILQPWAIEQMKKTNDAVLAGHVPLIARERCWRSGVPGYLVDTRIVPLYFLQTKKEIVTLIQMDARMRHIYLDVPHSKDLKPSWYGESVGRYENGELVVDTIGLNDKTFVDNYRTPHTAKIHVVEYYKLLDNGSTLEILVTVDDLGALTAPWSAIQRYKRVKRAALQEERCAENNSNYLNEEIRPMPVAERPDF
ncbi:MAG TPA: hypothetical protein VEU06_06075 [Micropepsaceae bacterium]|nr:hypothetical protein [Micropepsaceae bacterium]